MRKQILTVLGAGLIGLMSPTTSHATVLDFTFSFSNTIGNVGGTVTGEIFGLTEGATSSATNVVVDSYSRFLMPPSPPQTISTNIAENTFTVNSMGEITAAEFLATNTNESLHLCLNCTANNNYLENTTYTPERVTANLNGFSGATYTPVPAPLLATGLATLWPWCRRRRRTAPA
jgi:hypothetical protein